LNPGEADSTAETAAAFNETLKWGEEGQARSLANEGRDDLL